MPRRTALYRHFDDAGALLYVGIALSPTYRLSTHRAASVWAQSIAHVTMEWFDSRDEALAAEKRAIETENPRHNIVHNRPSGDKPSISRATVPAVPEVLYSKEQVAVYLQVSYRQIERLIDEGMPRTQTGDRKFSYDMGVIKLWLRSRDQRHAEIEKRAQKRREDLQIQREIASAKKASDDALLMEQMRYALMKIGVPPC